MMNTSCFFCDESINLEEYKFLKKLQKDSENNNIQTYVIRAPLVLIKESNYEYDKGIVILRSQHKISFIDLGNNNDQFEDYCEDFLDDLKFLSEKYQYIKYIGRPRKWSRLLFFNTLNTITSLKSFLKETVVSDIDDCRIVDCIISLLIGSVNNINKIGGTPIDLLDAVKKRIILFDCDQTRFIYQDPHKPIVKIQGLAGTGKTELLLHKVKDLYMKETDSRIVFTCFNKVLAQSMIKRIPDFFDFMKVEEQIKWNERLWVMHGWGSIGNKNSGVYSYICNYYNLTYHPFSYSYSFDKCCKEALTQLNQIINLEPCFDYILIDEGQDFKNSFIELCRKVTKRRVYLAGDVFQDIYSRYDSSSLHVDFLLNKCYRTSPKNLMFAHAIGMGLYEKPIIRWLKDEEWTACGYQYNRKDRNFTLTRVPLTRFNEFESEDTVDIMMIAHDGSNTVKQILDIIKDIRKQYSSVQPGDIAIVFVDSNNQSNYCIADYLEYKIPEKFSGWSVVKGYETKDSTQNSIYISNKNNIKGLEFPFVICLANETISRDINMRNTLYMTMTRSFITTYLLLNENLNKDFCEIYGKACKAIETTGYMQLIEPSEEEKKAQNNIIMEFTESHKSIRDIVTDILSEPKYSNLPPKKYSNILDMTSAYLLEDIGDEYINIREVENRARGMIDAAI